MRPQNKKNNKDNNDDSVQDMEVSDRVTIDGEKKDWKDVLICKVSSQ